MTPLEQYLAAGREAGCTKEQMENFLRAAVVLQPRQLAASATARSCDGANGPTAVGYGGGSRRWKISLAPCANGRG